MTKAQGEEPGYGPGGVFLHQPNRHAKDRAQIRALLIQGMVSGNGSEMNDNYFDQLRERIINAGTS